MQILSNSPKISRNGTRRFVTLSAALILSFCILSLVSVNDVRAGGLKGIGVTGPSQFPWSQFYVGADAFPVMIAINKKISIESDSHGIIFKRGSVHVNNYLDGGSTLLKKFVGIIFAPLFYCFRHPLLLLAVFFCLSVLFILIEHVMNNGKNDEFAWINKRNRNKRKQYQNAAPYVLFIREQKRRSRGDRKSLSDEQHHVQAS